MSTHTAATTAQAKHVRHHILLLPILLCCSDAVRPLLAVRVATEPDDGAVREHETDHAAFEPASKREGYLAKLRAMDRDLHPTILKFLHELESKPEEKQHLRDGESFVEQAGDVERTSRVFFTVYSDSSFYGTRLSWVRDTWGSELPRSSIQVIGDVPPSKDLGFALRTTQCPAHSHWEGACCKYAEAVIHAHDAMQADSNFAWAYFTDDDAYVRPGALEAAVNAQDGNGNGTGVMLGNFGCNTPDCQQPGLCGGGGYAASRQAVAALVGNSPADFLREQMASCGTCSRWADIALTKVADERGIAHKPLAGLNGWKLSRGNFSLSLQSNPLMYHYINEEAQMKFLHSLFMEGTASSSTSDGAAADGQECATFDGRTECATTGFPWNDV